MYQWESKNSLPEVERTLQLAEQQIFEFWHCYNVSRNRYNQFVLLHRLFDVTILLQQLYVVTILLHRIACNCYNILAKGCNNGIFHCYACYNAMLQALQTPPFTPRFRKTSRHLPLLSAWHKYLTTTTSPGTVSQSQKGPNFKRHKFKKQRTQNSQWFGSTSIWSAQANYWKEGIKVYGFIHIDIYQVYFDTKVNPILFFDRMRHWRRVHTLAGVA